MAEPSTQPLFRHESDGAPARSSSVDSDLGIGRRAEAVVEGRFVGQTLGDVAIESFLAAGGMGEVYRGREVGPFSPGRAVAVKVIRTDRVAGVDFDRFKSEIRMLGRIDDPGIARILHGGVAEIDGRIVPYYVMELVADGESLVAHVRRLGLDRPAIVDLFLGVVDTVAACHRRRIVHRDLKPGNILVDAAGRPKVVDFGVACLVGDVAAPPAGTLSYMSPEQAGGELVDSRSDVFSLGIVLYELLAGRRPFEFPPASMSAEIDLVLRGVSPPSMGTADAELETIVRACLAADPALRFASAGELGVALRHWSGRWRPCASRRTSAPRRSRSRSPRFGCEPLEQKIVLAAVPTARPLQVAAVEPPAIVLAPAGESVSAGLVATVAPGGAVQLTAAELASRLPDPLSRRVVVRNPRLARGGGEGRILPEGDGVWTLVVGARQTVTPAVLTVHFEVHDTGIVTPATAIVAVQPSAHPDPAAFAVYGAR